MNERVAALDIGGSGCRVAWVDVDPGGNHQRHAEHHLGSPGSVAALSVAIVDAIGPVERLGVSTAGFVDSSTGTVSLCRVQPWFAGSVAAELSEGLGGAVVRVVNDGEAHLLAHLGSVAAYPLVCFSFGTSVGFGSADERGQVVRPRSDANWEIGSMRIRTRATTPELWWALGSHGLAELQQSSGPDDGLRHFGWRIGGMLHDFTTLFQPRTIVLTGGIIEDHGAVLVPAAESELESSLPSGIDRPLVHRSPFGRRSALVGAGVAVVQGS